GALATAQPFVDQATATANAAVAAAEQTATQRTLICVLPGRWNTPSSTGSGTSDCFVYDCSAPSDASKQGHQSGRFSVSNADVTSGPVPVFTGGRNFGLDLGGSLTTGGTTEEFIVDAVGGTLPAYTGYWSSSIDGLHHLVTGVLDLLPASTVDPAGGSDYFINGVLAFAEPQQDTLVP
nr:hypothetical protein [Actinomycetota bacterium]